MPDERGELLDSDTNGYDEIVRPYRPPCDCGGPCKLYSAFGTLKSGGSSPDGYEVINPKTHPAPEWVWRLAKLLWARGFSSTARRALEWCAQGDPEARSAALRTFITVKGASFKHGGATWLLIFMRENEGA